MLNLVSKLLFTLSALGAVSAVAYGLAVDERSGVAIFLFLALAAAVAGAATCGSAVPDLAPVIPDDAPPPQRRASTVGAAPRGSIWPLVAAGALTALAVGAAIGPALVGVGAVAVVAATGGWFAKVWSEDPTWIPKVRERVSARLLVPVGLPVATFLLAAFIAISVSRLLLAISKDLAAVVAIVVGVTILSVCSWVAARPRLRPSVLASVGALAAVSILGAGIAGAVAGERNFEAHEGGEHGDGVVHLVAKETSFNEKQVTAVSGEKVHIEFENRDDVYHNFAVYKGEGSAAKPVFNGEGFSGEDERTYEFTAPPPGRYVFVCDFHANMTGEFVSVAG
ncbi:MAG TPA: cupredoxin domain-containing protein [Acidimicrobiales bacterium]|nr:cupredoxin domain-containing protein [Acidimicrobiales bacterium]